jgi:hypothetical protein
MIPSLGCSAISLRANPPDVFAKAAQGLYQPKKTTWVKIKNPNYSRAAGR